MEKIRLKITFAIDGSISFKKEVRIDYKNQKGQSLSNQIVQFEQLRRSLYSVLYNFTLEDYKLTHDFRDNN